MRTLARTRIRYTLIIKDRLAALGHPRILVPLFFLVLLIVGVGIHKDFGISWDEKTQYIIGKENTERIATGKPLSDHVGRRFHGASVEVFLYNLPKLLGAENAQELFQVRHLGGFFIFFLGVVAFYFLGKRHFRDWRLGLLGAVMLAVSPRIFAHSFFNSRDIPTLVFFVVSMLTLLRVLENRTDMNIILHAMSCALVMSIRMVGLLMPLLTVVGFFLTRKNEYTERRKTEMQICIFLLIWIAGTMLLWPLLWDEPLKNFLDAYKNMSTKEPGGFYFGKNETGMPWHWIPVWMFISTPIVYTLFFLTGLQRYASLFRRSTLATLSHRRNEILFLLWLLIPTTMIMVGFGNIFDTWRHVFFVYPAFLLISLEGIRSIPKLVSSFTEKWNEIAQRIAYGALALSIVLTTGWMVISHPLQYVYFSIPRAWAEGNFELDYWGLAYTQAFEYILELDDSDIIPVIVTGSSGITNINMLKPEQRSHFIFVGKNEDAKYALDNFRKHQYEQGYLSITKIHSIYAGNIEVLGVYKNPNWNINMFDDLTKFQETRTNDLLFYFGEYFMDASDADYAEPLNDIMKLYFEVP